MRTQTGTQDLEAAVSIGNIFHSTAFQHPRSSAEGKAKPSRPPPHAGGRRAAEQRDPAVPPYWELFSWWPLVRPKYLVWMVVLGTLALYAGGLAGIVLGGHSECEARKSRALSQFGYVVGKIQEQVAIRTLPVVSLGTFVRQTPYFPDLVDTFESIAADLLGQDSTVKDLQLAPAGVVSAIYATWNKGALGHNLWLDPNRRPDSIRTVRGAPRVTISNPVRLNREGQDGLTAVFARYPIFIDGPIGNRTEAFGRPDAYNCTDLCYGDPDKVYWGFTTALVDFDLLMEATGLTTLHEKTGACFTLRATGPSSTATDELSDNSTIFRSACTATDPVIIPVAVPNTRWYLEIGYEDACKTWVTPVAMVFSLVSFGLLFLGLFSVHQSLSNTVLNQLSHESELSYLREREEQAAREEATAGSDTVRWLLMTFCQAVAKVSTKRATPAPADSAMDTVPHRNLPKFSDSFTGNSPPSMVVIARIWQLDAIRTANPLACRSMVEEVEHIMGCIVQEHSGQLMDSDISKDGTFKVKFQNVSMAVAFALKLRRELMEAPWPEEVLALPGCGQQTLAVSFQRAAGPQLQMFVTCHDKLATVYDHSYLCKAAVAPRQILITGPAMLKLASLEKLMAAGYPDIRALGTFICGGSSSQHILLRINDPKWDLRLPQVPDPKRPSALMQVLPPEANVWGMPSSKIDYGGTAQDAAVVSMMIAHPKGTGSFRNCKDGMQPPDSIQQKLNDTANAMSLLFGGFNMTPGRTWSTGASAVVAFPDADSALSFSACFQHNLLHTHWSKEELKRWGSRETGHLGKLSFAGPRVKMAIDLQPPANLKDFSSSQDMSGWGCERLLGAAHGGQILMSSQAFEASSVVSRVEKVRIVDLGVHSLDGAVDPVTGELQRTEVKEVQLADITRRFPRLDTHKELSPGFESSPDPNLPCSFVFCSASCPGGANVSSSAAFREVLLAWQDDFRLLLGRHSGYELHNRGAAIAAVFPSIEVRWPSHSSLMGTE